MKKPDLKYKIIINPRNRLSVAYFLDLIRYRDLLYFLIHKEIAVLYKQTVLGFAWAILRPLFSMVIFSFVFGRLANMPSDGVPYPIFSYVALVPWTYFSTAMTKSSLSLISFSGIFTKVYFPRVFIPVVPTVAGLIDFIIALSITIFLMIYYNIMPNSNLIILPYLVVIMVLFSAGIGFFLSALSVQYRDIRNGIQFLVQLLMYATPVVWPVSLLSEKFGESVMNIYCFYPMVGVIEGFRSALIGTTSIPWNMIFPGTISSVAIFTFGMIYYSQKEKTFADVA